MKQFLTLTVWWAVPVIWLPVVVWCISMSVSMGCSFPEIVSLVALGIFIWTFIEYCLHRFLFHMKTKSYWGNTAHYLIHGYHHKHPMDHLRLVFPPALTAIMCFPLWNLAKVIATPSTAPALFGGGLLGYVMYDLTHYYLHHANPTIPVTKSLKKSHLNHHFRIQDKGYGVTSSLWDIVFDSIMQQEKLQRAASRAEEAEKRKLDKEMEKRGKGKLALKSIVAEIDLQLVEGALGAPLITLFAEKGITYRVISNPIKSSIVWTMTTLPEDVSQKIPYVLLVYEAEEFCNLVANERLLENVSRVREQYPSYTVCYLTNKLISYVEKREKKDYNVGKSNGWNRPPIDEVLAKLTTHYDRVHSRHCIDGPEVAAHVVGLTSSLASCHFRKKSSWLSVKAEGVVASMDSVDKHLIKKSPWLKALIAIPKVQPRYAVAVGKKYPTMKSLLKVYMDPNKSEQEKELLLKDLKLEGLTGKDTNLGIVGSKRIYRVLMSRAGELKTDEVASQIYSPHDLD
ncbi:hypothetical protein DY000_02034052 [Brassica cretica]|uniref:Fatty acid hydroxylase domain-containing protein n=1 Tax=Brassica cretica TaxID=69181 RepID=A0ABQ7DVB8_BRACR|nr:hypothetical protein DY000_02034052 [Brassica cretica]